MPFKKLMPPRSRAGWKSLESADPGSARPYLMRASDGGAAIDRSLQLVQQRDRAGAQDLPHAVDRVPHGLTPARGTGQPWFGWVLSSNRVCVRSPFARVSASISLVTVDRLVSERLADDGVGRIAGGYGRPP